MLRTATHSHTHTHPQFSPHARCRHDVHDRTPLGKSFQHTHTHPHTGRSHGPLAFRSVTFANSRTQHTRTTKKTFHTMIVRGFLFVHVVYMLCSRGVRVCKRAPLAFCVKCVRTRPNRYYRRVYGCVCMSSAFSCWQWCWRCAGAWRLVRTTATVSAAATTTGG